MYEKTKIQRVLAICSSYIGQSCRLGIPNPKIYIPEPGFFSRVLYPSLSKATGSMQNEWSFMAGRKEEKVCRI